MINLYFKSKHLFQYEKEQIMKTNVWINLKWTDFQLNWTTNDFKVGSIRVPYERVWVIDKIILLLLSHYFKRNNRFYLFFSFLTKKN